MRWHRNRKEHTAIPQPPPCSPHIVLPRRRAQTAPGGAGGPSAASAPSVLSATSFHPRESWWGLKQKATLWKPQPAQQLLQAAAAVACLNSFTTGLDDVGSSFSLWPSISHGWGKDSLSTVFSFSSSQQNLSAADAWLGGCALARALLPLPTYHKSCNLPWPWKERGAEDKAGGASDICVLCSNKGICHTTQWNKKCKFANETVHCHAMVTQFTTTAHWYLTSSSIISRLWVREQQRNGKEKHYRNKIQNM